MCKEYKKLLHTLQGKTKEKTVRYPLQRVHLCTVQHVIIIQGPGPNVEAMSKEAKVMLKHPKLTLKSLMVPTGPDRRGEFAHADIEVYQRSVEHITWILKLGMVCRRVLEMMVAYRQWPKGSNND